MIEIYIILALSLNLLMGFSGLFSLAHAAFYGSGAYICTLLMVKLGFNYFLALPAAIIGTMVLALVVSLPSLKLKGDYFMLATLAFQICVFSVLYNWIPLTRGPYGIPGIPSPSLFGFEISGIWQYFIMGFLFSGLVIYLSGKLYSSPFGRALKSIRDDELAVLAAGKNITKFKVLAFVIAGGIAAVAGTMFATYVTYIDPTSFTLDESIFIVTIIVIGGTGNLKGPIAGVFLLLIIPEALRFLRIPDTVAPNVRQILYGILLIIIIRVRPRGLLGEYEYE